jgi:hypothetical protein
VLVVLKSLYFLISFPSILLLLTLTTFIFRHPDLELPPIDRASMFLLLISATGSVLFRRKASLIWAPIMIPMVALAIMATSSVVVAPYDAQTWSFLGSKFIVPYLMFFVARAIFNDDRAVKQFFVFCIFLAGYLIFTAVVFLIGAKSLVLPQYILDSGLGEQSDRARGPFLQAVANGTAINILVLMTLYWFRKRNSGRWLTGLILALAPFIYALF